MSYKIVFLDIDGTILPKNHIIQDSTKEAVFQLKKKGIKVVIATGRPILYTTDIADELRIDSFLTFNGAHATLNGESIFSKYMDEEFVKHQLNVSKKHSHDVVLRTLDDNFLSRNGKNNLHYSIEDSKVPITTIHTEIPSLVLGSVVFLNDEKDSSLYEGFKDYELAPWTTVDDRPIYDIQSRSVNKGTGIRDFLSRIGLSKDEAVAFGDGLNDTDMLQSVGMGIAMGNAHKGLLPYADKQTTTVENDGIYNGLKDIGLL